VILPWLYLFLILDFLFSTLRGKSFSPFWQIRIKVLLIVILVVLARYWNAGRSMKMKQQNLSTHRFEAIFILLFFVSSYLNAQPGSTIGIKGGMNVSHLSVSGLTDESNYIGYHFGIFARLGLTHCFGIQPEALFSTKGAELNFNNALVSGGAVFTLRYVDVPILGVINVTRHFNLHAGPYFSWLIDASVKNNSTENGSDFESEVNKDNFQKTDAGIVAGAGVSLGAFSVGARYIKGLQNVGKERSFFGQSYNFPDGKNTAWQVYMALSFF
jgi:hypothetical protein